MEAQVIIDKVFKDSSDSEISVDEFVVALKAKWEPDLASFELPEEFHEQ